MESREQQSRPSTAQTKPQKLTSASPLEELNTPWFLNLANDCDNDPEFWVQYDDPICCLLTLKYNLWMKAGSHNAEYVELPRGYNAYLTAEQKV